MTVYEFLKQHNMLEDSFDQSLVEKQIREDIENKNSISMINSYQKNMKDVELKGDILVIDMGGTNLRFSEFKDGVMGETVKQKMLGIDRALTSNEFFEILASEIDKYEPYEIGFCFSYPCEVLSNKDAKIIQFSKEVKISDAEGKILGEELNKRLKKKRHFSILNDTVASQLGVAADVGMILGTGFNICYSDKQTGTIIVTECGQYQNMPKGDFDLLLMEKLGTEDRCIEKHISGAYIGKLARICACEYFGRELPYFDLPELSDALKGEGPLYTELTEEELRVCEEILKYLMERGAFEAALLLKCFTEDYDELTVALEGSTIYKLPGYYDILKRKFDEIVKGNVILLDARGTLAIGSARSILS